MDAAKSAAAARQVEAALQRKDSRFVLTDQTSAFLSFGRPSARFYWGLIDYRGMPRPAAVVVSDEGLFVVAVSLPHACINARRTDAETGVRAALSTFPREIASPDEELDEINNLAILLAKWVRGELGPTPPLPPLTS